jgi:hypothetical protein
MANRDLSFDNGDVKLLLVIVLSRLHRPPARPAARPRPAVRRARDRDRRLRARPRWNVTGEVSASNGVNIFSQNLLANFPSPPTWIDDATGGKPTIYLGQQITDPQGIWLMEFWNKGLTYVWSLDGTAPPPGRQAPGYVTPDAQPDGTLVGKSIPQGNPPGVDYMVADNSIQVAGKQIVRPNIVSVITEDEFGFPIHKEVTTPGTVAPAEDRPAAAPGKHANRHQLGRLGGAAARIGEGRAGVQRLQPVLDAGRQARLDQNRRLARGLAWQGQAGETSRSRSVTSFAEPTSSRRWARYARCCTGRCTPGQTRVFSVPADPPTRVELTVSPTFSPYEFGGSDRRELGAQVSYSFSEKRPG